MGWDENTSWFRDGQWGDGQIASPSIFIREAFGYTVCSLDDVNSDGHPDFAVGDPLERVGKQTVGSVTVFSGRDGSILHAILGAKDKDQYGKSICALADVNHDDVSDFAVGGGGSHRGGQARVAVHSGKDGAVLLAVEHEVYESDVVLACGPDVDEDKIGDLLIGFPDYDHFGENRGVVHIISTTSGKLIGGILGAGAGEYFGSLLSTARLNDDRELDLLIGANNGNMPRHSESKRSGVVRAYDGASGNLLYELAGERGWDCFGYSIAVLGDLNHDGNDDFAIGAPGNHPAARSTKKEALDCGYVRVYSGRDGAQMAEISGCGEIHDIIPEYQIDNTYTTYRAFGYALGAVDLDDEPGKDLVIGIYGWKGIVMGISSSDYSTIFTVVGGKYNIGASCAIHEDVNMDGVLDIAIGDVERCYQKQDNEEDGRVLVVSGIDGRVLRKIENPRKK